jgi:hypothetical protein
MARASASASASARDCQDALRALKMVLTPCGRRSHPSERSRRSRHFPGVGKRASAQDGLRHLAGIVHKQARGRDGLDALWASATSARALETVLTP